MQLGAHGPESVMKIGTEASPPLQESLLLQL